MPRTRPAAAALLGVAFLLATAPETHAAPVRGKVTLPADMKAGRRYLGYWRVDNGNVPIQPASPRGGDAVVVLLGAKGPAPAPRTATVELVGLAATPRLLLLGPGSVVDIRNNDRIAHDLSMPAEPQIMPLERLTPGGVRRLRSVPEGAHVIRSADQPHIAISVLVLGTPHVGVLEENGAFTIADAPEGKATLKLWAQGRWVHAQEIVVAAKGMELQIQVQGAGGAAGKEPSE